jgi:hypothetical protein
MRCEAVYPLHIRPATQLQTRPLKVETGWSPGLGASGAAVPRNEIADGANGTFAPVTGYPAGDGTRKLAVAYEAARSHARAAFCVSGRGHAREPLAELAASAWQK